MLVQQTPVPLFMSSLCIHAATDISTPAQRESCHVVIVNPSHIQFGGRKAVGRRSFRRGQATTFFDLCRYAHEREQFIYSVYVELDDCLLPLQQPFKSMRPHDRDQDTEAVDHDGETTPLLAVRPAQRRRSRCTPAKACCCLCMTIVLLPILLILAIILGRSTVPTRLYPTPYRPDSNTDLFRPALGLYLGPSYA